MIDPIATILKSRAEAAALRSAIVTLSMVKPETITSAIDRLNHAESIGPIFDPTAWMGNAFRNVDEWRVFLRELLPVVQRCNELRAEHEKNGGGVGESA